MDKQVATFIGEFRGYDTVSGDKKDGSGKWEKMTIKVLDTKDQWAKSHVIFQAFRDAIKNDIKGIEIGSEVEVTYSISANSSNDRVFINLDVEMVRTIATPKNQAVYMPPVQNNPIQIIDDADDDTGLPF